MSKIQDFYDKPIYTIPSYLFNFLLGGLYFFICNILLVLFFSATLINPNGFSLVLLFISLIPMGPALAALTSSMTELIREKSISFTSYFFKSYKRNFISTLKLWCIILFVLLLLFIDFQYFYLNLAKSGLYIIFVILGIYVLILSSYAIPINSRFELNLKDIFILSTYYTIKKLHITILKIVLIMVAYYLTLKIHNFLTLLIPSVLSFVISYYDNIILKEIESKK